MKNHTSGVMIPLRGGEGEEVVVELTGESDCWWSAAPASSEECLARNSVVPFILVLWRALARVSVAGVLACTTKASVSSRPLTSCPSRVIAEFTSSNSFVSLSRRSRSFVFVASRLARCSSVALTVFCFSFISISFKGTRSEQPGWHLHRGHSQREAVVHHAEKVLEWEGHVSPDLTPRPAPRSCSRARARRNTV